MMSCNDFPGGDQIYRKGMDERRPEGETRRFIQAPPQKKNQEPNPKITPRASWFFVLFKCVCVRSHQPGQRVILNSWKVWFNNPQTQCKISKKLHGSVLGEKTLSIDCVVKNLSAALRLGLPEVWGKVISTECIYPSLSLPGISAFGLNMGRPDIQNNLDPSCDNWFGWPTDPRRCF